MPQAVRRRAIRLRRGLFLEGRTVAEGNVADLLWAEGRGRRYRLRLASGPPPAEAGHVAIVARDGDWWTVDIDPARPPDAAWRELMAGGWRILEIQRACGGLEDLYLALTERRAAA